MKKLPFLLPVFVVAIVCSCSNEKDSKTGSTTEQPVQKSLSWQDSLDRGILYSADFITVENKFVIDSILFGLTSQDYFWALAKFYSWHKVYRGQLYGLDKGYFLKDFHFRDVDVYYDNTGLFALDIMAHPSYYENADPNKDALRDLTAYLTEKYGRPHTEEKGDAATYLKMVQQLGENKSITIKSWTVGGKRISICLALRNNKTYHLLRIYKIANAVTDKQLY